MIARNNTAKTATRAACGFLAPNSFETLVLNKKKGENIIKDAILTNINTNNMHI
jgi:hypothetical protein